MLSYPISKHVPASPVGTIDRLDVLEIVALNTVHAAVTLGDFDGDAAQVPITFEILTQVRPLRLKRTWLTLTAQVHTSLPLRSAAPSVWRQRRRTGYAR